jgi:hypothetical protein
MLRELQFLLLLAHLRPLLLELDLLAQRLLPLLAD